MNILSFSWLRHLCMLTLLMPCPLVTYLQPVSQETYPVDLPTKEAPSVDLPTKEATPFDLDDFFKELEKELTKIEAEGKDSEPKRPAAPSTTPTIEQKTEKETTEIVTPDKQPAKTDPESLFVEPATQKVTKKKDGKSSSIVEPTKKSIKAYEKVSKHLINTLNSLQNKALSAATPLSPSFVDTFTTQGLPVSDDIKIILEAIESKKAYISLFVNPPADSKTLTPKLKDLRKKILNLTKKLETFDANVVITPEMEEAEETEDVLRNLAIEKPKITIIEKSEPPLKKRPVLFEPPAPEGEEIQPSYDIAELMTEESTPPIPSFGESNETLLKSVLPSNVRMFDEK